MRKLQRGPAPICLSTLSYKRDAWGALSSANRDEIWSALIEMQGNRCAYCECEIFPYHRHIEHFQQRSRYAGGTFKWDNLFGSCQNQDSCGNHKDKIKQYDTALLIKADVENPDDFFIFVIDGTISIRNRLCATAQQRAEETLKIFNLDSKNGRLRNMRRTAVLGHWHTVEDISEMATLDPNNECGWQEYLESEIQNALNLPFSAAIRHALSNV